MSRQTSLWTDPTVRTNLCKEIGLHWQYTAFKQLTHSVGGQVLCCVAATAASDSDVVAGGLQWKGAEPSIWNLSLPQFHILDGVHERVGLPAGLVHRWCHPAKEWEAAAVRPSCLRRAESARLADFIFSLSLFCPNALELPWFTKVGVLCLERWPECCARLSSGTLQPLNPLI